MEGRALTKAIETEDSAAKKGEDSDYDWDFEDEKE